MNLKYIVLSERTQFQKVNILYDSINLAFSKILEKRPSFSGGEQISGCQGSWVR